MFRHFRTVIAMGAVTASVVVVLAGEASASAGKGTLFHDGATIRTVVVSAPVPGGGTDPFYEVTNGPEASWELPAWLLGTVPTTAVPGRSSW